MFKKIISKLLDMPLNQFHLLVHVSGRPKIGKNVYIGLFSEINSVDTEVVIGDNCDIASFVDINAADSHEKAIGLSEKIERRGITLEHNVFVGSHSFIGGGVHIGHHSVVAAGTIITKPVHIPPYSLIVGNPFTVKEAYYKDKINEKFQ